MAVSFSSKLAASAFLLLLLLLTVLVAVALHLLSGNNRSRSSSSKQAPRLPPSPPGLPLLGHLHLLGALAHRALRDLARAHGPVLLLRLGRVPAVLVSSAAAAEEVMRARDLDFASRPRSAMADRLLYGGRDVAFAPYGEYWRQARRVCVAHLLSARCTASFRRVREQEAAALVARVQARAACCFGLGELLVQYANAVVSRAAFGDESAGRLFGGGGDERGREIRKVFTEFQELLGTAPLGELLPWLGWVDALRGIRAKAQRTFEALDGLLDKVIDDHRRRPHDDDEHRDFVDVLLDVHKNDDKYGIRLETNEIKAIILDMFAAGTDTTTTVMEWAMAELVTHPGAMRRVQAEIRAAAASTGGVTEDLLDGRLRYLKAVVKETLRLHAPIPLLVPREPPADAEILGHHVPARTRVVINAWAIARDPAAWDRADEFLPERFLQGGSAAGVDFRGKDFALVPFGAGRRGCPGVGFAEPTIEMALASLLYHFDWETGTSSSSLDMSEMNGLSVHIKSGLPLVAKPYVRAV